MRDATQPDDIRKLLNKSLAQDPAHITLGADRHHLFTPRQRSCWFGGLLTAICLLALYDVTGRSDEAARIAELKERQISRVLARARCSPPAAPLEQLVGPIATQVGDKPVTIECVYVTSTLPTVPQLRYAKALIAEAGK